MEKILPYPLVPTNKDKEKHLAWFMQNFKQLEIKIPLSEAIQQMAAYANFLKDLLSKKSNYIEEDIIKVQGNCSVIIKKTLPPNFKDPGSFIIPCTIGNLAIGKH